MMRLAVKLNRSLQNMVITVTSSIPVEGGKEMKKSKSIHTTAQESDCI